MDYIADALTNINFKVNIISPSWLTANSKIKLSFFQKKQIRNNIKVLFFPSWRNKTKVGELFKISFSLIFLLLYLTFFTKRNEKILVYHAQWLYWPIKISKWIRKYKLVLEVEEIYAEVWKTPKYLKDWETKIIDMADEYIFVSDVLQERFINKNKNSIVLYGAYQLVNKKEYKHVESDSINLIYAGSIDYVKGGAFKSLDIIESLPENYTLHILGNGNSSCMSDLMKRIKKINQKKKYQAVIYKGVLHAEEFSNYLLNCDIAINPQNHGEYMNTAFPSKVITYLAHYLTVISTPIKSILMSKVAGNICFTNDDSTQSFVKTLLELENSNCMKNKNIISELNDDFMLSLKKMLKSNNYN